MENLKKTFTTCQGCKGQGKKSQRIRKKVKLQYHIALALYTESNGKGKKPTPPKSHPIKCLNCDGTGLIPSNNYPVANTENYPKLAIIGGGIGGVALAVACLHRGIPFTLYEWDASFNDRSQGYGLTLQQASNAIKALGITTLKDGVISTRHLVHTTDGNVIGEWGMRKWVNPEDQPTSKRTNVHIARQSLRLNLLNQLNGEDAVKWGHQLVDFTQTEKGVNINFKVNGKTKTAQADLLIGADGIRSAIRNQLIGEKVTPLRYLGVIVILGICPLKNLKNVESHLLDMTTVFQTVNGSERIYMMPYTQDTIMWQLSFPLSEDEAKKLSAKGPNTLKVEANKRMQWHTPIPQIVAATEESKISGYPVYDREILDPELLKTTENVTLIGDAAHPMSPFKGQGANQALLDALSLARRITKECTPFSNWKESGIRKTVLNKFEKEMIERSAKKVKDSAEAIKLLHSEIVLRKGDGPRGRGLKRSDT